MPVRIVTKPLTPFLPALTVCMMTEPLEVERPCPVESVTDPPRPANARPPVSSMLPPSSAACIPFASPPFTWTAPPFPPSAAWVLAPSPPLISTRPPTAAPSVVRPATICTFPPSR